MQKEFAVCTDLLIVSKTSEGKPLVVNARSQEFDAPLGYRLILRKRGLMVKVTHPKNTQSGVSLDDPVVVDLCVSKYNYMGVIMTAAGVPVSNAVFDGMNEAGLSVGGLNAPSSKYQSMEADTKNVFIGFFADWMLSNYATCEEVKAAFKENRLRVVADNTGDFKNYVAEKYVTLHFAVHDATGKSLVIEFIDGIATLTDNPIGVLTNLPVFSWHLTNLGMYAHLSNFSTTHNVKFGDVAYAPPGSLSPGPAARAPEYRSTGIPGLGDGLAGIPGDFRPASRFVRTAYMKKFAVPPESEQDAVSQAFHLLNGVDIVKGASADKDEQDNTRYDTAQIIMVKDMANKVFYVRMYESPMPHSIDFKDFLKFAPDDTGEPRLEGIQISIPTRELAQPLGVENLYQEPVAVPA